MAFKKNKEKEPLKDPYPWGPPVDAPRKLRKQHERYHRAKAIEELQEEVKGLQEKLENNKDTLTKEQKRALKKKLRRTKSDLLEFKHPAIETTKTVLIGILDFLTMFRDFADYSTPDSGSFEESWGGDGYTRDDVERVIVASTEFGAAAANAVRAEIEERIESERSNDQPERD